MGDLSPGTILGGYRILGELGQGGMGTVYRAEDPRLGRQVALKVVSRELAQDRRFLARFEREARVAASISHPHVVATHGAGEEGGRLYLALELLPGGSLAERIARGPLPWREAARLAAQVARGLDAIHALGLVHRDVKPANLLLDARGDAKLADFGLVRGGPELTSASLATKTGELVGTYEYLAPEQTEGKGAVDGRTDLYSLGATVHALIVGAPPFEGQGYVVVTKHLLEPPKPLRRLVPAVPLELERLVLRLLAKAPSDRPASASEVATALEAIATRPDGGPSRKLGLAGAGVIAVLAAGGVALRPGVVALPPVAPPVVAPPPAAPRPLAPESSKPRVALVPIWNLSRPEKLVSGCFTPDGLQLAIGSPSGVELVTTRDPKRVAFLPHPEVVWDLAITPDGGRILTAAYDGTVRFFEIASGRCLSEKKLYGARAYAVALSPSGRRAASAGEHGGRAHEVHAWSVGEGGIELLGAGLPLAAGTEVVERLSFYDESRLVSLENDGVLRRYTVPTTADISKPALELLETIQVFDKGTWMRGVVLLGRSKAIVAGWNAGVVQLDLDRKQVTANLPRAVPAPAYTGGLALSSDQRLVVYSTHPENGGDSVIEVRDAKSFELLTQVSVPCAVSRLLLSKQNQLAVIGEGNGGWAGLFDLTLAR